ncbi:MAG: NAD-binding protein [Bacteroidota bacterium]|nr:NAD-binding protein [Bacteroidota bacterium]
MLLIIIVAGITGYMLIEGDGFLNALYMTIITISTVGFGEIHELSIAGKTFTIILILSSFGTYAYAISIITTYFVESKLSLWIIKGSKGKSTIKKMEKHVIICGFGRNGQQAAEELKIFNKSAVIIENDHDLIIQNLDRQFRFIEGNATDDEVLVKANVKSANALITTLPNDADNLFVVLSARSMNPDLKIISRASNESSEKKLRFAGANNVILPEKVGGNHMAILVAKPDIVEFLEHMSLRGSSPTNLEEIVCADLQDDIGCKSIHEIGIRQKTGANIIGFKTPEGEFILNPSPETNVIPGSKLFVLGNKEQIETMKKILKS